MKIKKKTMGQVPDEQQKITVTKNGPYSVTGKIPLSDQVIMNDTGYFSAWREGKKYPLRENYSLCRCGHAKNRPFCDGMHTKTGFDGTETATRKPYADQAERFEGPSLILTDFIDLCASARFCDRAGGNWNLTRRSDNFEAKSTDAPRGFGFCLRPRRCDDPQDAIEPIIVIRSKKSICQKKALFLS